MTSGQARKCTLSSTKIYKLGVLCDISVSGQRRLLVRILGSGVKSRDMGTEIRRLGRLTNRNADAAGRNGKRDIIHELQRLLLATEIAVDMLMFKLLNYYCAARLFLPFMTSVPSVRGR